MTIEKKLESVLLPEKHKTGTISGNDKPLFVKNSFNPTKMLFNSIAFATFFIIFFFLYWLAFGKNLKLQNALLLVGCYFFYGLWDWTILLLLIGYSLFNYRLGYYIYKAESDKTKNYLAIAATTVSIGLLAYFKYANFFISAFNSLLSQPSKNVNLGALKLILPLGISFYTFRTLSYIYDIKNEKLKPTDDWVVFFSFVAFFPSLLAGPIDRAKNIIPQLEKERTFDYDKAVDAMRQILWGLFKKIVIADNLASVTDGVFNHYSEYTGSGLFLATVYYSIQIYTDFSGYSDMAIGFAKLLGFDATKNFNYPFFAQNVAEFWRKWHISLTSWLTDYVFTPLSMKFRDYGKLGLTAAIIINFTLIGIWHGANWTFAVFGILHALYFIPLIINGMLNKKKKADHIKLFPGFKEFKNIMLTFMLVTLTYIIFRADNLAQAWSIYQRIFSRSLFTYPKGVYRGYIPLAIIFMSVEWVQRGKQFTLQISNLNVYLRSVIYWALIAAVFYYSSSNVKQFIYLKF